MMDSPVKQTEINAAGTLRILSSQVDEQNEGFYRIYDEPYVRYVRIQSGTFEDDIMCWPNLLIPALPPFPRGPWKSMTISRSDNGTLQLQTNSDPLEAVELIWHPARIDIFSLPAGKRLKTNVWETVYQDRPAILKFASFPWEIPRMEWETWAYRQIESKAYSNDARLAPSFLGHVEENGRVIGLLLERIEGSHAGIAELELCKSSIRKIHDMGICHGDPCRHNFIVDKDRKLARVVDFENARPLLDPGDAAAEEELESLKYELKDNSARGARLQQQ